MQFKSNLSLWNIWTYVINFKMADWVNITDTTYLIPRDYNFTTIFHNFITLFTNITIYSITSLSSLSTNLW
jgi:hypothetical protein